MFGLVDRGKINYLEIFAYGVTTCEMFFIIGYFKGVTEDVVVSSCIGLCWAGIVFILMLKGLLSYEHKLKMFAGFFLALILNDLFSPYVRYEEALLEEILIFLTALIMVWKIARFDLRKDISIILAGSALSSLILSSGTLLALYLNYVTQVIPQEASPIISWKYPPKLIYKMYESIFLATLFTFLERLLKSLRQ